MRETWQLKRVLSPRESKLQSQQFCEFCTIPLFKGERATSYGVIDRADRTWERVYFCPGHAHVLENTNTEDLPLFLQEWLIENGYANEEYNR